MHQMASTILEMRDITKTFPGVKALSNVNLSVEEGEIHAVVGENGAGKSTLMKVLSGVYPSGTYDGQIIYRGQECQFKGIHDSEHQGIVIIHQELALVPMLSIAENIFLGNEHAKYGVIDWDANEARTGALLKKVGLKEDPKTLITNIGVGKQQLVEIAKALSKEVKLLILDEPTASLLSEKDSQALLDLLLEFKRQGITSILISHKLNEVNRVADHVTIIRDGQTIETLAKKDITRRPHHHLDGRPLARRPLSAARAEDRRGRVRGEELVGLSPAPCRPAGDQGHRHQCAQGRGGRHCRADGRRPHRIRHEPVRPLLWPPHHRRGAAQGQADRRLHRWARRSSTASPT